MAAPQLPLRSAWHKNLFIRPFIFWIIANLVAAFACSPGRQGGAYHFASFFSFMAWSTLIIGGIAFLFFLGKKRIIIDHGQLIRTNVFGGSKKIYKLSGLTDFTWSNKPQTTRTRYGGRMDSKREAVQLHFKDGAILDIAFDEFGNFDEIKKYLFRYCVKNKIITIRPLEERRAASRKRK